jgi:hypothetical protein
VEITVSKDQPVQLDQLVILVSKVLLVEKVILVIKGQLEQLEQTVIKAQLVLPVPLGNRDSKGQQVIKVIKDSKEQLVV